jgi:hypothetical protein
MEGYDVVTFDGKRIGKIAGVAGDFYIVERGKVWKTRAPLPKRFARVDEDTHAVRAGISSQVLLAAPRVGRDGTIDEGAVSAFYALDDTVENPPIAGRNE